MPEINTKSKIKVRCCNCRKVFFRNLNRHNEGKKFGWRTYCSNRCLGRSKRTSKKLVCERDGCNNIFLRTPRDLKKTKHSYCSHRCAMIVFNSKRVLKSKKKCRVCDMCLTYGKIYCSPECQRIGATATNEQLIRLIRNFYDKNGRIPYKREFSKCHAARDRFGTWNNAIIAAGFDPNPVRFAKKYVANDGHKCDSLAERIIDDWLARRNISHKINFPYPGNKGFTADFVVGEYWIEFFGLSGELEKYDELKKKKLALAKKLDIPLIKLYPKDLFPKGNLNRLFEPLITS